MTSRKSHPKAKNVVCGVCGRSFKPRNCVHVAAVRPQLADELSHSHPDWRHTGFICREDLLRARQAHLESLLIKERGELTDLDRSVAESVARHDMLTTSLDTDFGERLAFGDRLADRIADLGCSWAFIIGFVVVLTT